MCVTSISRRMILCEIIGMGLKRITVRVFSKYFSRTSRIGVGLKESRIMFSTYYLSGVVLCLIMCLVFVKENVLYSKNILL